MCTVIHEFTESRLLLCPLEKNITNDTQAPSPSFTGPSPSFTATSPSFTGPSPSFTGPSPSFIGLSPSSRETSPSFIGPSPSFRATSPSSRETPPKKLQSHCGCSSPVPSPVSLDEHSKNASAVPTTLQTPNLHWLHVLWCLPVFLVVYLCYKRHCCSRMKVGIARRRYEMRSKSWPRRVRTPHPAVAKRSRSESFDTIVL